MAFISNSGRRLPLRYPSRVSEVLVAHRISSTRDASLFGMLRPMVSNRARWRPRESGTGSSARAPPIRAVHIPSRGRSPSRVRSTSGQTAGTNHGTHKSMQPSTLRNSSHCVTIRSRSLFQNSARNPTSRSPRTQLNDCSRTDLYNCQRQRNCF